MLEHRPLLQRTLYASGAFALVFSAAMAGTGVMISGGIFPAQAEASASTHPVQPTIWDTQMTESAPTLTPAYYGAAAREVSPTIEPTNDRMSDDHPSLDATPPDLQPIEDGEADTLDGDRAADASDEASDQAAWEKLERDIAAIGAELSQQ